MTKDVEPKGLRRRLGTDARTVWGAARDRLRSMVEANVFVIAGTILATGLVTWLIFDLLIWPVLALLTLAGDTLADVAGNSAEQRAEAIRNFGLLFAGIIGALLAAWRTAVAQKNNAIAEKRAVTETFTKAVELLGARTSDGEPALEVRIGAIYALEKLAQENIAAYHLQIMDTLGSYVRQHTQVAPGDVFPGSVLRDLQDAYEKEGGKGPIPAADVDKAPAMKAALAAAKKRDKDAKFNATRLRDKPEDCLRDWTAALDTPREDVRIALTVMARCTEDQRNHATDGPHAKPVPSMIYTGHRLDLAATAPHSALLANAEYAYANLFRARMEGASLSGARMEGADLFRARMEGADLSGARMEGANLSGARMDFALLTGTDDEIMILKSAKRRAGTIGAAALRFADWREAEFESPEAAQAFFDQCFGDATVALPDKVDQPAHWPEHKANDEDFYGHWRGVWESAPNAPAWGSTTSTRFFEDVKAKQPIAPVDWGSDP